MPRTIQHGRDRADGDGARARPPVPRTVTADGNGARAGTPVPRTIQHGRDRPDGDGDGAKGGSAREGRGKAVLLTVAGGLWYCATPGNGTV